MEFSKHAARRLFNEVERNGVKQDALPALGPAELDFVSVFFDSAYKSFTAAVMEEQGIEVSA